MRLPEHAATTANVAALYPFMAGAGLPRRGIYIGDDRFGGGFVFSPFELYRAKIVSGPNAAVFGRIGRAKSALLKTLLYRSVVFGARGFVLDPKGEYAALAEALGLKVLHLRPGGTVRLNPLESMVGSDDTALQRLELLQALAETSLGRRLASEERTAIELGLEAAGAESTIPAVVDAMVRPRQGAGSSLGLSSQDVRRSGRQTALELRRMVAGDMRGMFDGPTTPGLPLNGEVVVLDLSGVYHSAALPLVMTCIMAWLRRLLESRAGRHHTYVVVDEAWVPLSELAIVRWLREGIKLARQFGTSWWLVLHKVSDLAAVGAAGSEQARVAQSLLDDLEIRIIYAQATGEIARHGELLGLSETEKALLPRLGQGRALWKIGERSAVVQHRISPAEVALVDSDFAMHRTGIGMKRATPGEEVPMGYVLTTDSTVWRAETAAAALVALVELRRDGDPAVIRDAAGRRVAPQHLLAEAVDQVRDPRAQRALATVLADYVDFLLRRELDEAREMRAALFSPDREADLLLMEAKGEPTAGLHRTDAGEVERLNDMLFGGGAWREAGGAWAYSLGEPPRLLLDELVRRHPDGRPDQFVVGAYEQIASREPGSAADQLGDDQARSLISDLLRSMSGDDVIQIVAEAVRVNPAVRSKAELLLQEWRRLGERAQWTSDAEASSPAPAPTGRPRRDRPPGPARWRRDGW